MVDLRCRLDATSWYALTASSLSGMVYIRATHVKQKEVVSIVFNSITNVVESEECTDAIGTFTLCLYHTTT